MYYLWLSTHLLRFKGLALMNLSTISWFLDCSAQSSLNAQFNVFKLRPSESPNLAITLWNNFLQYLREEPRVEITCENCIWATVVDTAILKKGTVNLRSFKIAFNCSEVIEILGALDDSRVSSEMLGIPKLSAVIPLAAAPPSPYISDVFFRKYWCWKWYKIEITFSTFTFILPFGCEERASSCSDSPPLTGSTKGSGVASF